HATTASSTGASANGPLQRQRVDAGDAADVEAHVGVGRERVLGDAAVPLLHRDAQLEARGGRAEAPGRARGEGDVPVVDAVDVEHVGVVELARVAVGGRHREQHAVTCLHRATGELDVAGDDAVGGDDRVHPQRLLDERRDALGFVDDA